jgi:hypothetical protein
LGGCRFPVNKTAESQARTIRAAIQNWQSAKATFRCPTFTQLVDEKLLDTGTANTDPWGRPYRLTCTDEEVFVGSVGQDGKEGTDDDIQIPKTEAQPSRATAPAASR